MTNNLTGKVALVTGGSRGIGAAELHEDMAIIRTYHPAGQAELSLKDGF